LISPSICCLKELRCCGRQAFNWESWKQSGGWYNLLTGKVDDIAAAGVTHVWLPPPSHSAAAQGPSV
jgi:alpha-amylase